MDSEPFTCSKVTLAETAPTSAAKHDEHDGAGQQCIEGSVYDLASGRVEWRMQAVAGLCSTVVSNLH